ncbi:MAG: hypothetical protein HON42_05925, partial [Alphaproteobacteria bacterium]|nr:hypothetical protein [Alphaproteobacteria bacterium]
APAVAPASPDDDGYAEGPLTQGGVRSSDSPASEDELLEVLEAAATFTSMDDDGYSSEGSEEEEDDYAGGPGTQGGVRGSDGPASVDELLEVLESDEEGED